MESERMKREDDNSFFPFKNTNIFSLYLSYLQ
jgi:hypothetical protein